MRGSRRQWTGARVGTALVVAAGCSAAPLAAVEGRLEINQKCAEQGGCFRGDKAGFPVTIALPGSYVLTSNLATAGQGDTAIAVQVDHVALDLNGFVLTGNGGSGAGILLEADHVAIENGTIREFANGITATDLNSQGQWARVSDVVASSNLAWGIAVGDHSSILDCTVTDNAGFGILVPGFGSTVRGNLAIGNGANRDVDGFDYPGINATGVVRDNVARDNFGTGIHVGGNSVVTGNVATGNLNGIRAGFSAIIGNTANNNQIFGIALSSNGHSLLQSNEAKENGVFNIQPCSTCTLVDNHDQQ